MFEFVYVFVESVYLLLTAIQFLMLFRALISWLPLDDDSPINNFLYCATEPVIFPVRKLLERFPSVQEMPIDISFMVTVIIISVIQLMLPVVRF